MISHAPKSTKSTKKYQRAQKHQKAPKAQKRNQAKAQNVNERTRIKNAPEKHIRGTKVIYLLICVFVLAKKTIDKSLHNGNVGATKLVKVVSALYEEKLVY